MDPISVIGGIASVAKAVNILLKKLMEYKPNIAAVEGLVRCALPMLSTRSSELIHVLIMWQCYLSSPQHLNKLEIAKTAIYVHTLALATGFMKISTSTATRFRVMVGLLTCVELEG